MTRKGFLATATATASAAALVAALTLGPSFGCDSPPAKPLVRRAEFGIFFGGQVEERRELPFELDRSKQTLGFRVEFSEPLTADTNIEWRIDRPARNPQGKASPRPRKGPSDTERPPLGGKDVARAGESRFEKTVGFEPGDPLGLWNVRVVIRGKVAIDRSFDVYDAANRQKNGAVDSGL